MDLYDSETALAKLKEGNARFVSNEVSSPKRAAARRIETVQVQHPFAVIVACYDSRVAPEIVFDLNIGDAFVLRNAGNVVNDHILAGVEFAVRYLAVPLVVVLGHSNCAAVNAAITAADAPGHIQSLLQEIQPAIESAGAKEGDLGPTAIGENARLMADKIRRQMDVGEVAKDVRVVSGIYHLETGEVRWHIS